MIEKFLHKLVLWYWIILILYRSPFLSYRIEVLQITKHRGESELLEDSQEL